MTTWAELRKNELAAYPMGSDDPAIRAWRRHRFIRGFTKDMAQPRDIIAEQRTDGTWDAIDKRTGTPVMRRSALGGGFDSADAVDRWVEDKYEWLMGIARRVLGSYVQVEAPGLACRECGRPTDYDPDMNEFNRRVDYLRCEYCGTSRRVSAARMPRRADTSPEPEPQPQSDVQEPATEPSTDAPADLEPALQPA